ncbi:mechanosensitive ion channel domain-containing protein [Lentisphaerota bacterium WC36G]|nr:mechanosensitive ion channel family protein [Lentisphaerae bacterium WC36]
MIESKFFTKLDIIRNSILEFTEELIDVNRHTAESILDTLLTVGCFILVRKSVLYLISHKEMSLGRLLAVKKAFTTSMGILLFLILIRIWIEDQKTMINFLGLVGAGLAIALQDMIKCFAGWVYIIARRPFSTGDRIQIGDTQGDVIDIGAWKFTINEINEWAGLDQSTGRIIHIPNSQLLTKHVANYTAEFAYIWNEMSFTITFESNWQKTIKLMEKVCDLHVRKFTEKEAQELRHSSKKYMLVYTKLTPIVYTKVKDNGVLVSLRYLVKPRERRFSEDKMWQSILNAIEKNEDISLAYNTLRIHQEQHDPKLLGGIPNNRSIFK